MSPQDFLAHFHEIANAPGGVARLRELILSLAVRGMLVPQDTSDEPASMLLQRVKSIAKSSKRNGLTARASSNGPHLLPQGWIWTSIGELALLVTSGYRDWAAHYSSSGAKFVRMGNLSRGSYRMRLHSVQHVRPPSDSEGARTRLEANDILISITGEVGLLGLVPDGFGEAYINQHTCLIRLPEELQNRYIAEYLRSPFAQGQFNEPQRGLKNSFRLTDVTGMLVALPPLAEQKRIVAKVEELMALCDALEAQQQERARLLPRISRATHTRLTNSPIQPHLDSLFTDLAYISPDDMRRTIINLAFQGNLTQQLPYDDPADAIVQRLSAARSRHETKGGLRSRIQLDMPLQSSSAPFGIPNSWKWGRLHEVAWIKHGYAFDSGSFSDTPTDYVVATPGNFFERGGFRERGVRTKYFAGKVDPEFIFHAGDLIIPMTEQAPGLLGSPAFIPDDGKTYIHNQRLGKLCFYSDEVSPWFAYCFFNTPFFRSELSRTCTGMKVRHTSPSRVLAVPFPICSIAEQRRIVAKVDELMALVDTLEAQQQQKSRLAEAFAQTCVASLTAIASD